MFKIQKILTFLVYLLEKYQCDDPVVPKIRVFTTGAITKTKLYNFKKCAVNANLSDERYKLKRLTEFDCKNSKQLSCHFTIREETEGREANLAVHARFF